MQQQKLKILTDYIKQAYEAGVDDQQITQNLLGSGWVQEDIIAAMAQVKAKNTLGQNNTPVNDPKNKIASKYTLTQAFKDVINAIKFNVGATLLAGVITVLIYIIYIIAVIALLVYLFFSVSNTDLVNMGDAVSQLIIFMFLLLISYIWFYSALTAAISTPVKDGLEGTKTKAGVLFKNAFVSSWRVAVAYVGIFTATFSPIVVLGFVIGLTVPLALFLFVPLAILGALVIYLYLSLTPYIALFDKSTPLLSSFKKSVNMVKNGAILFLVKFFAIILALYILLNLIGSSSSQNQLNDEATSASGSIMEAFSIFGALFVILILMYFISVVINGILVALYVNRSKTKDLVPSGNKTVSESASPLA